MDGLYDLAPEAFVAERDALAKALRKTGDRVAAAAVKQLRRPTRSAWTLNQLARSHPEDVRLLVQHGQTLAEAQERALAGEPAELRQAGKVRMEAVRHLTRLADGILGPGGATQRDEVVATLTAASADAAAGAELLAGRLSEPLAAPSGFGDPLAGWAVAPSTGEVGFAPAPVGATAAAQRRTGRPAKGGEPVPAPTRPVPIDQKARRAAAARLAKAEVEAVEARREADAAHADALEAAGRASASARAAEVAADRVVALETELRVAGADADGARAAAERDAGRLAAAQALAADGERRATEAEATAAELASGSA